MSKTANQNLGVEEVEYELDEEEVQGEEENFDDSLMNLQMLQPRRTARSEIEIRRELLELRKVTGEYYEKDIFD